MLSRLLLDSFEKLGVDMNGQISKAQEQAVYFHFIKFELTNFIIDKIGPDFFNMTCKDGIDRGGVASAYYNLMKSIECGYPMSEKEFNRALHGATALVKGRPMNHHVDLMWNVLDQYMKGKFGRLPKGCDWMVRWGDKCKPRSLIRNAGVMPNVLEVDRARKQLLVAIDKYIHVMKSEQGTWARKFFGGPTKQSSDYQERISSAMRLKEAIRGTPTKFSKNDMTLFEGDEFLAPIYYKALKRQLITSGKDPH